MKSLFFGIIVALHCFLSFSAWASIDIIEPYPDPIVIDQNNQQINITVEGLLYLSGPIPIESSGNFSNTAVYINSSDGIFSENLYSPAISISGAGASLDFITVDNGYIRSDADGSSNGAVYLAGGIASSPTITIGSGGQIVSSREGNAIYSNTTANTDLTISNAGLIDTFGNTSITLLDGNGGSTISLTNSNSITGGISISGFSGTINNSGGSIDGNINVTSGDVEITNGENSTILGNIVFGSGASSLTLTSPEEGALVNITGNVDLGSNADSYLSLDLGVIQGNVTMNNSGQIVYFTAGVDNLIDGTISGSGQVIVNRSSLINSSTSAYSVTSGNISVGSISIVAGRNTLDAANYNNSITADNITLGSQTFLLMGTGALTGVVDGASANRGSVRITLANSSDVTLSATFGSTNGIQSLDVRAGESSSVAIANPIKASFVTFTGLGSDVSLGNSTVTSDVVTINDSLTLTTSATISGGLDIDMNPIDTEVLLGNGSVLNLNAGDLVVGTIDGLDANLGDVVINTSSDYTTLSATFGSTNGIHQLTINNSSEGGYVTIENSINASYVEANGTYNDLFLSSGKSITATINLNGATLYLASGTSINGDIRGFSGGGGSVAVSDNVDFVTNGTIGSNTNPISSLVLNEGSSLDATTHDNPIYANYVNLRAGSTLTSSALISGGLDGDSNPVEAAIFLSNGANLVLNSGAAIDGNINALSVGLGAVSASGAVSFQSIGDVRAVGSVTTASGSAATFANDISATGAVTINGDAIFSQATTAIAASSFTVNSGATLSLTISDVSATSLEIAGAAMISSNITLNLTISGTISSGTVITLLDATSSSTIGAITSSNININDSGANIYGDNSFSASVLGNKLLLTANSNSGLTFSNSNDQSTYNAINNALSPSGELSTMKSYLSGNSHSLAQKEAAVRSASTQSDNSSNRVAFNNVTMAANLVSSRLESLRSGFNSGVASGDGGANKATWAQTFGATVNQGNGAGFDGYNAHSAGIGFGFDNQLEDVVVGVSAGYSRSKINAKNSDKNTAISTYQLGLYGGYNADSFFLNTSVGVALNNYDSSRYITVTNSDARAKYSGKSYNARAELGSTYGIKNDILFTPSLMLTAAHNAIDAYSESGAGTLNLHVKNNSTNFFEGRIGAKISRLFSNKDGQKFLPQFSLSYGYDFAGDRQKSTSNFIGQNSSFSTGGAKIAQGSLRLGTGLTFYNINNVALSANYDFEHRSNYISHTGWLKARYEF